MFPAYEKDEPLAGINYNDRMRCSTKRIPVILACFIIVTILTACPGRTPEYNVSQLEETLQLETRLEASEFSLMQSNEEAVAISWEMLDEGDILPASWHLEFAGEDIAIWNIDPGHAVGIMHPNGRVTTVYPVTEPITLEFGEIEPVCVAHYYIPEPRLDIILLLVCFQSDPDGSNAGVGVKSINIDGIEISAPFALALRQEDLSGLFFYDEFISGAEGQRVAAREEWDQGFLLLTRIGPEAILSTYLPWY